MAEHLEQDDWYPYFATTDEMVYLDRAGGGVWTSRRARMFPDTDAVIRLADRLSRVAGNQVITARLGLEPDPLPAEQEVEKIQVARDAERRDLLIHIPEHPTIAGPMTIRFTSLGKSPRSLIAFSETPDKVRLAMFCEIVEDCTRPMTRREIRRGAPVVEHVRRETADQLDHDDMLTRRTVRAGILSGVISGVLAAVATVVVALWITG